MCIRDRGYALDALFRHEKMVLTDEDIEAACRSMSPQQNPKQVRNQMEQTGRGFALREAAERLKANRWLVDHAIVNVVDPRAAQAAQAAPEAAAAPAGEDVAKDASAPAAEDAAKED